MKKVSIKGVNNYCPQCLYLYGTYKEDNSPNYGLFCWATYCADNGFKFVACIGEDKLTRDRIRATGMFSASIVSEEMLSQADYCGCNSGYKVDKSMVIASEKGEILNVPIPVNSPWTVELKVDKTLCLDSEGKSEIYICDIVNVRVDERIVENPMSNNKQLEFAAPVLTMGHKYVRLEKEIIGSWGQIQGKINK